MTKRSSTGMVIRIEPDGFGIVRENNSDRKGFFILSSTSANTTHNTIRKGTYVRFDTEDSAVDFDAEDSANELMKITWIEPVKG